MADTREFRSVVEAAEQAAAAGDYASAEQLLHAAALLQEASLGPLHPDLANTLNNLGVVCEITGNLADAERYFRRAWEIATAVLEPDHPFVATSRKNLEDFCSTRGIAVDAPSAPPGTPVKSDSPATPPVAPPVAPPERDAPVRSPAIVAGHVAPPIRPVDSSIERHTHEDSRAVAPSTSSRPIAVAALVAGALVVALIAIAIWRDKSGPADVPKEVAATTSEPAVVAPKAIEAPAPTPPSPPIVKPAPVPPAKKRVTTAPPTTPPVVAAARLCKELSTASDWHCAPPSSPIEPGPVYFYSRVKSPTDTTIQHRWYHGGRLLRTAELRIGANAIDGYRTFSRTTVNSQGSADWRVELRSKDGAVLHEERFVVR
jgi:hypothetical protein